MFIVYSSRTALIDATHNFHCFVMQSDATHNSIVLPCNELSKSPCCMQLPRSVQATATKCTLYMIDANTPAATGVMSMYWRNTDATICWCMDTSISHRVDLSMLVCRYWDTSMRWWLDTNPIHQCRYVDTPQYADFSRLGCVNTLMVWSADVDTDTLMLIPDVGCTDANAVTSIPIRQSAVIRRDPDTSIPIQILLFWYRYTHTDTSIQIRRYRSIPNPSSNMLSQ